MDTSLSAKMKAGEAPVAPAKVQRKQKKRRIHSAKRALYGSYGPAIKHCHLAPWYWRRGALVATAVSSPRGILTTRDSPGS